MICFKLRLHICSLLYQLDCHCSYSCAIDDDDAVVLTGGVDAGSSTKVTKYKSGQAISLPSLNTGRHGHACGKVTKTNGGTVSCDS